MIKFIFEKESENKELELIINSVVPWLKNIIDNRYELRKNTPKNNKIIIENFRMAFSLSPVIAIRGLQYIRDCRHGLGERRIFKVCLKTLARTNPEYVKHLLPKIPEFGRWDDMFFLIYDSKFTKSIITLVSDQLIDDYRTLNEHPTEKISYLAKWMPSINTSSKKTRSLAKYFARLLGLSHLTYRKMLVRLRTKLNVVEQKMSTGKWEEIDYNSIPLKAKEKYRKRFDKPQLKLENDVGISLNDYIRRV